MLPVFMRVWLVSVWHAGVGDRHTENLLVQLAGGSGGGGGSSSSGGGCVGGGLVPIDFGYSFGSGLVSNQP